MMIGNNDLHEHIELATYKNENDYQILCYTIMRKCCIILTSITIEYEKVYILIFQVSQNQSFHTIEKKSIGCNFER